MAASPSTLNYFIGKGVLSFTPDGGSIRDLGNAPEVELTPDLEELEHFSSRGGVRTKDRTVILEKGLTLRVVLDEVTPENLAMLLLGTVSTNTATDKYFEIFALSEIVGAIAFTGSNDIGNQYQLDLPSVSFIPGSGFNLISDEWGQIELTGDVLEVDGSFGTLTEITQAT